MNSVHHTVNMVLRQADLELTAKTPNDPRLGAVLARSVVPDVTRYLRIRRM
jgi:hypothetical protein